MTIFKYFFSSFAFEHIICNVLLEPSQKKQGKIIVSDYSIVLKIMHSLLIAQRSDKPKLHRVIRMQIFRVECNHRTIAGYETPTWHFLWLDFSYVGDTFTARLFNSHWFNCIRYQVKYVDECKDDGIKWRIITGLYRSRDGLAKDMAWKWNWEVTWTTQSHLVRSDQKATILQHTSAHCLMLRADKKLCNTVHVV